jgi:hypothetical protein
MPFFQLQTSDNENRPPFTPYFFYIARNGIVQRVQTQIRLSIQRQKRGRGKPAERQQGPQSKKVPGVKLQLAAKWCTF